MENASQIFSVFVYISDKRKYYDYFQFDNASLVIKMEVIKILKKQRDAD